MSEHCLSKLAQEPLRCRGLVGNRFEGRVPPSLLAMRIHNLLYAPLPVSAREPASPRASGRRCSLFPQEGCPLARYGREGQDKDANGFGVCVAGPVRPLVAVPIGPSLQHAHKAPAHKLKPGDWYYRRTSERSSAGNVSRSVGREWPHFSDGLSYHELTMVHILECACLVSSPQHFEAARRKRE